MRRAIIVLPVECTFCDAKPDDPCTKNGLPRKPHAAAKKRAETCEDECEALLLKEVEGGVIDYIPVPAGISGRTAEAVAIRMIKQGTLVCGDGTFSKAVTK